MSGEVIRWEWRPDEVTNTPKQLRLRLSDGRWTNIVMTRDDGIFRDDYPADMSGVWELNGPNALRDLRIQFFGKAGERVGGAASATDAGAFSEPDFAFDLPDPDNVVRKRRLRHLRMSQRAALRLYYVLAGAFVAAMVLYLVLEFSSIGSGGIQLPHLQPGTPLTGSPTPVPTAPTAG